ncbi:securin [Stegastes partitus]|uniref:Securin n=1 Tax=Stegastes partitus TaxID=144197 RepID=A0A3B5AIE0_9TELE|nr:PREDICTED: securin-like [Stegastes partitus]XP_008274238.1 PREDICTED: securin-like [Stegastes partitus]
MANIIFADHENAGLQAPTLKMRQRLQFAPEKLVKPPMTAKTLHTPLPSGRKAFGIVTNKISTSALNTQEKKLLKPQEASVKHAPQVKVEEYPEIEKFFPYDPLEFEKYSIPEDFIPLSDLPLAGLARLPKAPHLYDDVETLEPLPNLSPVKMPRRSGYSELAEFLQELDKLTTELPPEPLVWT